MSKTRTLLATVPTPMAGLALGIVSLGWSCEHIPIAHGWSQMVGAIIASIALLVLTCKFLSAPHNLRKDLADPIIGSVVPTYAMAIMLVSKALYSFQTVLGVSVWLIAVLIHIIFLITFCWHRAREFQLHHMIPSWFVPPVGIIVAAVSYPNVHFLFFAQILFWFGMLCYVCMLPLMLHRLIFGPPVTDAHQPTIAVLAAPASLSLAGYLTVIHRPSFIVIALLFGVAVLMTVLIWHAFFRLLRLPFTPAYAAFTFPMVIGATALFKLSQWMSDSGLAHHYVQEIHILADIELTVAAVIVLYVIVRYVMFFKSHSASAQKRRRAP